jgi:hypothetical protein
MKSLNQKFLALGAAAALSTFAVAEDMDRPAGFRIGQRMTLKPYVSLSATYDSNVSGSNNGGCGKNDDVMWTINPGLGLEYQGDSWTLLLSLFYNYHAYCQKRSASDYNEHSYGETLRWNWNSSKGAEKGWSLMLTESFNQVTMADDISLSNGRSYTGDRRQLTLEGAVQRRFNENWHSEITASYYFLDYQNETENVNYALYGWQRWTANLSVGFAPSPWTDFIGTVGYQGYRQDNSGYTGIARDSQGYTAQIGVGTFATERITYRALAGWSRFEYGNNSSSADGFVYTVSGNWKISDTWNTMLLATSYYQPSEYEQSSQSRVDSISWGLGKSLIRGKLRATLDITYHHDTQEYVGRGSGTYDYALDTLSGRFGLDYTLNRYLAIYGNVEYLRSWNDHSEEARGYNDYDRWRVTIGARLTY